MVPPAELASHGYDDAQPIGRGGLGDVYRATRSVDGTVVAIKILRDDTEQSRHRIARELTALRVVGHHAHVIAPIEVLHLSGGPALVMEYAPGGSIADRIRAEGTLTLDEAVFVARQTAAGLATVHARGIVHRDVKPQNLLIDSAGQIKLCDFGISALLAHDEFRTRTNAVSMQYASPEDLEPDTEVGPASDVYSMGASLLFAWRGQTLTIKDRLTPWQPAVDTDARSAAFDRLIAACLQTDPADRPDAERLMEAFDRLALGGGTRLVTGLGDTPAAAGDHQPATPLRFGDTGFLHDTSEPPGRDRTTLVRRHSVAADQPTTPPDDAAQPANRRRWPWQWSAGPSLALVAVLLVLLVAALVVVDRVRSPATRPGTARDPAMVGVPSVEHDSLASSPHTVARPAGLDPLLDLDWTADVGECLVQVPNRRQLAVVGCDQPHDLQQIADGTIPGDGAFVTDAVAATVGRACDAALPDFVGTTPDVSALDIAVTRPSSTSWAAGDRSYACYVGIDGRRVIGDARTSGW